eukprot:GHVH01002162.1.p1 GENE.GHVH01002162.1~~GHVH01002162.1.p1  ORF type:complete len:520 (+),score=50.18 GHVH01002162.1:691-2250(+)
MSLNLLHRSAAVFSLLASKHASDVVSAVIISSGPLSMKKGVSATKLSKKDTNALQRASIRLIYGEDIGRLDPDVTNCLAPLLLVGAIRYRFEVDHDGVFQIKSGHPIPLRVYIELNTDICKINFSPFDAECRAVLHHAWDFLWDPNKGLRGPRLIKRAEDEEEDDVIDSADLLGKDLSHSARVRLRERARTPNPRLFVSNLRSYQEESLGWMMDRECNDDAKESVGGIVQEPWCEYALPCGQILYYHTVNGVISNTFPNGSEISRGGILADGMGLGKTVQMLSLFCTDYDLVSTQEPMSQTLSHSRRSSISGSTFIRKFRTSSNWSASANCGGTLLVLPVSLVRQWRKELERHLDPDFVRNLIIIEYYGPSRDKYTLADLCSADLVITSYNTMQCSYNPTAAHQGNPTTLWAVHWWRIVYDECHVLKDRRSLTARSAFELDCRSAWCVTGTPIQNSVADLFSLVRLIKVQPWADWPVFNKSVVEPIESNVEDSIGQAVKLLRRLCGSILLRRNKNVISM